jgi:hypothetical protein
VISGCLPQFTESALGFDEQGREEVIYLPGETVGGQLPWPARVSADSTLSRSANGCDAYWDAISQESAVVITAAQWWFSGGVLGADGRPIVGHAIPGIRGVYAHTTPVMTTRLLDHLQQRWLNSGGHW